jgi:PKD repeat protein
VNFAVSDTIPHTTDTISFNDLSIYNPVGWQWEFFPGTVTFINGTSSASQNPDVVFTSPGIYTVSLTATNLNGSNSLQKEKLPS